MSRMRIYSPSDQAWNGHPPGVIRRVAIGDLADMSQARRREMGFHRGQKTAPPLSLGLGAVAANGQPCLDEGAKQPRPDRALMIGAIARSRIAAVVADIGLVAGRETA